MLPAGLERVGTARYFRRALAGIDHVAVLTGDTARFLEFYGGVFGATSEALEDSEGFKLTVVWVGPRSELNVFEVGDP